MRLFSLPALVLLSITCSASQIRDKETYKKLFAVVDQLALRQEPDLSSAVITRLAEGSEVSATGRSSQYPIRLTLREKEFEENWIEVEASGLTGWVYGAGLHPEFPPPPSYFRDLWPIADEQGYLGFIDQKGAVSVRTELRDKEWYSYFSIRYSGLNAHFFMTGLGEVFIDRKGKIAYRSPQGATIYTSSCGKFSQGRIFCWINRKKGYGTSTTIVYNERWEIVREWNSHCDSAGFSNGYALIQSCKIEGKHRDFIIDREGIEQRSIDHLIVSGNRFSEGLLKVIKKERTHEGVSFMNTRGEIVIETPYVRVTEFQEGLAAVASCPENDHGNCKWGYMDQTGNLRIPLKFTNAYVFKDGKAQVCTEKMRWAYDNYACPERAYAIIDREGKIIKKGTLDDIIEFDNQRDNVLNLRKLKDGHLVYRNASGDTVWTSPDPLPPGILDYLMD